MNGLRLLMISYHPPGAEAGEGQDPVGLYRLLQALAQRQHRVYWLSSAAMAQGLAECVALRPSAREALPATCRYVVPCTPYGFEGGQLFGVAPHLWQERDLHTRLFTFVRLLQRALGAAIVHAWGAFPAAYLAVYTARCLGLPVVVSYDRQSLREGPQQPFEWRWVATYTSRAVVSKQGDLQQLLASSEIAREKVQVLASTHAGAEVTLTTVYEELLRDQGP